MIFNFSINGKPVRASMRKLELQKDWINKHPLDAVKRVSKFFEVCTKENLIVESDETTQRFVLLGTNQNI